MKSYFHVPIEYFDDVKSLVRKYPSFRHIVNPYNNESKAYFYISGNVEDFNKFDCDLESLFQPPKDDQKANFFQKFLNFFTKKSRL